MNPEIRTIDPMPVLFVRRTGPYGQAAGEAFAALCQFAGPYGLLGPTSRLLGISHDNPNSTEPSKLRFDACVTIEGELRELRAVKLAGQAGLKTVAGGKYAVFLHAGPYDSFRETYDQIFTSWLPQSQAQRRDEPCFELYLNAPDQAKPEDLRTEIWVPIA
jgi:AraC family transcriptional regulator